MRRRHALLLGACALLCALSCKPKMPVAPARPKNTIVLLPDANGHVGGITVSNAGGSVDLKQEYTAVVIEQAAKAPSAPFAISKTEADRIFGSAVNVLPAPEQSFLVYFQLAKDDFTDATQAVLGEAMQAIKTRSSTDVSVVGHADTAGDPAANYQLALRRATKVAAALTVLGVDSNIVSVESHGDADLLVKTGRGVAEERNRRVEIVVR